MASNVHRKNPEKLIRIDQKNGRDDLLNKKFGFWTLIYLWFRSTTMIQASFNYAYFQGTGYSSVMYPFFKKIYGKNKEQFKKALISNMEFFNTGPCFGIQAIAATHLFMIQHGSTDEEAKTLKFALMGPLAGINDALFNFGSQPLLAGIAASLSANGSWTGFWFWMIAFNAFQFIIGILLTVLTYKSGEKFIKNLSSIMSSTVKIASMVGVTIISALAITYTSFSLNISTTSIIFSEGSLATQVTSYQEVADKFMPFLFPVLLVGFIYFMMQKWNWSLYKSLVFLILAGISLSVFGVI